VSGRDGKRVEIQIRTKQMHEVAEAGVAAHWSYKDGVKSENPFAVDPAKWIAKLTERFENAEDHDEFLENVKLEMYTDQVFCFTPKGEVVQLPRGATPLDFAYAIHTRIGDSCVGARVDNIRVPLWTRIKNGQSVEIITAEGQSPQATWLDIVVTGRAKSAIRRRLREEDRERFIKLGRELARVAFDHVGRKATDKALETAAKQLSIGGPDDLLARLGSADLAARDVVAILYPDAVDPGTTITGDRAVIGLEPDQSFTIAGCCQPVPGERIVGITYRGRGVVVHSIDCHTLTELADDSSRWVDVHWHSGKHAAVHTVTLELTISNDAGVLGRICTLIGEQKANISDLHFVDRKQDFFRILVDVDLRDIEHLHAVMLVLEAETDVASIRRHRDLTRAP
jgi:GTP pyrophosphokinase/guanosine-3',5'-bis(diphosphate) 3'-pyrophosphohydrolase